MGDPLLSLASNRKSEVPGVVATKNVSKRNLVASGTKPFTQGNPRHIALSNLGGLGGGAAGQVAVFLLKVVALETVRRVSKNNCPFVWRGLQALQFITYPPFKLIQRWAPFRGLIRGMQILSRPLLVLSVVEAFADQSDSSGESSDGTSGSHQNSEIHSDLSSVHSPLETRTDDEDPPSIASNNWLIQLQNELENQGISLPKRINEDELHRFYTATNGDFTSLLAAIKKTIYWRETYRILSEEELEMWQDFVFWHGFDIEHRPCLVVRLGLACHDLPSHERPRFAQAVVSQVEHGVLRFTDSENPQITVLVDCKGLAPLRIPMHLLRFCSSLLQDHYPNRLGCLFVIRLPPVVRVITQTFIQILKPVTRKKFKIEGEMYRKVLLEYLQVLPSYLGGNCTCPKCLKIVNRDRHKPNAIETNRILSYMDATGSEDLPSPSLSYHDDFDMYGNCDRVIRTAVVGILMLMALIGFIAGMIDPESSPFSLS